MIKAIETSYKGYKFRRRLEARYAVMFDALGVKWEYEPEGFELGDGYRYLPDFKITRLNEKRTQIWVEVKGTFPTHEEIVKGFVLTRDTKLVTYFLIGSPGENTVWSNTFFSFNELIPRGDKTPYGGLEHLIFGIGASGNIYEIEDAVNSARAARFEHGETP